MGNDAFSNMDAATRAAVYDSQIDQWEREDLLRWRTMDTAPKTGTVIEINYGSAEIPEDICLAFWSDRPVCMGGPTVYNKPGWATAGSNIDQNLPLDPPNFWRPI